MVCAGSDAIGVHAVFGTGVAVGFGVGLGVGVGVPSVGVGVAVATGVAVETGVGVGESSGNRGVASFEAQPAETTVANRSAVHEIRRAAFSRAAP
jgi:hypothetical protein